MHVIMGGTGHVGSAAVDALLARGEAVRLVTRSAGKASVWQAKGAEVAEADVDDVSSLRAVFRGATRALLLNPPADPATDTDAVERGTIAHILAALGGSRLQKIVAVSTSGARPGHHIGDLGTLWDLEEGLRLQPIPAAINRGAYYMSNWDGMLDVVRDSGKLPTMFPADLPIPMIAPRDLGEFAATRLLSNLGDTGIRYAEGPARYSPADVAQAFSKALARPVDVEVIPRDQWTAAFLSFGFSQEAAQSYAGMTALCVDEGFDMPTDAWRGTTSIDENVRGLLVRKSED